MSRNLTFVAFALILAIGLCGPIPAFSQATAAVSAPAAAPSKIAFVNMQEALLTCNEGKHEAAALQQRFNSKQTELKRMDDELKKLKDDFQAAGAKLNDDERNSRARTIQDKQKVFERSYADYQAEMQEAQQEAVSKIMKKMLPVLEKYVTDHGYSAVFDLSNSQTPILWVRKESIITQQVVEAYNAQAGAAPGPARPAPTPKP